MVRETRLKDHGCKTKQQGAMPCAPVAALYQEIDNLFMFYIQRIVAHMAKVKLPFSRYYNLYKPSFLFYQIWARQLLVENTGVFV